MIWTSDGTARIFKENIKAMQSKNSTIKKLFKGCLKLYLLGEK